MKKPFYRIRQWVFSVFIGLAQNKETKLLNERGSMEKLPKLLKDNGLKSICLVTTAGFIKRGTLQGMLEAMDKEDIKYTVFTNVTPDPTVACIEEGVSVYQKNSCDSIVAVGGGSVLDCAKVIAARITNPKKSVRDMRGLLKVKHKLPPYYPVPATCGTGSEVTAAAVVTDTIDGAHYKYSISDLKLIPDMAVLDANLLDTLPPFMLSTTTMDALTHALEAYTNLFASKEVRMDALEACKLIFNNFEAAYIHRDKKALESLLYASTLAGMAFTHNFVGYVHALAHAIGALCGLSHGYLNAIILPVVLEHFGEAIEKKMKTLCEYCVLEKTTKTYLQSILVYLNKMRILADLPDKIKELKPNLYDEIIKRALKEANPAYPVPVIYGKKELLEILKELTIEE